MTDSDTHGYLVATSTDGALELRLAEGVVRSLSIEAMRGFGVTRRRGTEVGGVLVGYAGKGFIVVEEFEAVPCEYAYGPSYLLSDNDAPRYAEAVSRWRRVPGIGKYAVGTFRSQTREGLRPDAADSELIAHHFGEQQAVLLLIKPYATRAPEAAFFVTDRGRLSMSPSPEFMLSTDSPPPPRRASEAAKPADPLPAAPSKPVPDTALALTETSPAVAYSPPPFDERPLFAQFAPKPRSGWHRALPWTAVIVAATVFGSVVGYQAAGGRIQSMLPWSAPIPTRDVYALGLSARLRGDSILIQWDRYSKAAHSGLRGTLVVTPPGGPQYLPLTPQVLRSGVVLFKTDATEADVRLEVHLTPERFLAEQIQWRRQPLN